MNILVLNAGSSSLKFALFGAGAESEPILSGQAENLGARRSSFTVKDAGGAIVSERHDPIAVPDEAVALLVAYLRNRDITPDAVGHRIVHGGLHLRVHCVITDEIMTRLEQGALFAPLHGPPAVKVVGCATQAFPTVPHVACLDTVFHRTLPDVARLFPLPQEFAERGLFRYGFHGLSCESVVHRLRDKIPDRLVIAHLGSGCSVTAVKAGRSVDTSMGFTPTGGVMMATRSGDLDPGLLIYLLRNGFDTERLERLLDRESGVAGISGISGDFRELEGLKAGAHAISLFCYAIQKQIGAMAVALGGLDMLVFTGGVGAHNEAMCCRIAGKLDFLGSFQWLSVAAKEEATIAGHVKALLLGTGE